MGFGNTSAPITSCNMSKYWPWPPSVRKLRSNSGASEPRPSPNQSTPVNESSTIESRSKSLRPNTSMGCSRADFSSKSRTSPLNNNSIGSKLSTSKRARSSDNIQIPFMKTRPHTTIGCSRYPAKTPRHTANSRNIVTHDEFGKQGDLSKISLHLNTGLPSNTNFHSINMGDMDDFIGLAPAKRPSTFAIANSASSAPTSKLQPVKSYSSPKFNGERLSEFETQAISGRVLKSPSPNSVSTNISDGVLGSKTHSRLEISQSHSQPTSGLEKLEPDADRPHTGPYSENYKRSPSINSDFKVNTGPFDSLVTVMPRPPPVPPPQPSTPSTSPSDYGRKLRRRHEAALRMYPRNMWGPVTKWGFQEDIVPGSQTEKYHYVNDKDKLEKQRLESRSFGHQRHWVRFKNIINCWETHEAYQSAAYIDEKERFLTDSERMLHTQNDKRKARVKCIDEAKRSKKKSQEFERLEKRESAYIDRIEHERSLRESPATKVNDSGAVYNIVTLEYPNNYAGDLLRFEDDKARWRQCMRALRIQSRQSGARLYNVVSWKSKTPCCVPPLKPTLPIPPDPTLNPSPRKPNLPFPRNMLHLDDTCKDISVGCTNDLRTNW